MEKTIKKKVVLIPIYESPSPASTFSRLFGLIVKHTELFPNLQENKS